MELREQQYSKIILSFLFILLDIPKGLQVETFCVNSSANIVLESNSNFQNKLNGINYLIFPLGNTSLVGVQQLQIDESIETISFLENEKHFLLKEYHPGADIKHGTNHITSMNNGVLNKYEREYDLVYAKVLAEILSNIMTQTLDDIIAIITDVTFDHSITEYLVHELKEKNIIVNLYYSRITESSVADIDYDLQDINLRSISVVFLLLPWKLAEVVIRVSDQNLIRSKKSTWILLNSNQVRLKYDCIHNIQISNVMNLTQLEDWIEDICVVNATTDDYKINQAFVSRISLDIAHRILHCTEERDILNLATLIDPPMVVKLPKYLNSLGEIQCISSHPCNNPIKSQGNGNITWEQICCSGLVIDIMLQIAKRLDVDLNINIVADGKYGGLSNGSWNGIINEVYSGRADIGVQGLTPTTQRSEVVDFTDYFMLSYFGIIRRNEQEQLPVVNWVFLRTLKTDLLLGLLVAFVIVFVFMFAYENLLFILFKRDYYASREAFSYIAGLTFQRDLAGKVPIRWSARIIAIAYAVATTIIMTTYTANLTADNINRQTLDGFKGLKDQKIIRPTTAFTYGVRRGTSIEMFFKESPEPIYLNAYEKFIIRYLQDSDDVGLSNVMNRNLDAFIGDYVYLIYRLLTPEYCSKLVITKEDSTESPLTFAVQLNSPLKHKVSKVLRDMREGQHLDTLISKWFYLPNCLVESSKAIEFSWEYIGGMLLGVGVIFLFSVIVVSWESLYTWRKTSKKKEADVIGIDIPVVGVSIKPVASFKNEAYERS